MRNDLQVFHFFSTTFSFRPVEMSSKRRPKKFERIPVHLRGKRKLVDPRFSEEFGDYNAKHFRESYHFITDLRRQELAVRRKQNKNFDLLKFFV